MELHWSAHRSASLFSLFLIYRRGTVASEVLTQTEVSQVRLKCFHSIAQIILSHPASCNIKRLHKMVSTPVKFFFFFFSILKTKTCRLALDFCHLASEQTWNDALTWHYEWCFGLKVLCIMCACMSRLCAVWDCQRHLQIVTQKGLKFTWIGLSFCRY